MSHHENRRRNKRATLVCMRCHDKKVRSSSEVVKYRGRLSVNSRSNVTFNLSPGDPSSVPAASRFSQNVGKKPRSHELCIAKLTNP